MHCQCTSSSSTIRLKCCPSKGSTGASSAAVVADVRNQCFYTIITVAGGFDLRLGIVGKKLGFGEHYRQNWHFINVPLSSVPHQMSRFNEIGVGGNIVLALFSDT